MACGCGKLSQQLVSHLLLALLVSTGPKTRNTPFQVLVFLVLSLYQVHYQPKGDGLQKMSLVSLLAQRIRILVCSDPQN